MTIKCQNPCKHMEEPICCCECVRDHICEDKCEYDPHECGMSIFEGEEIELFEDKTALIVQTITSLIQQKNAIKAQEDKLRETLQTAMETHGIKAWSNGALKLTYVAPTARTTIDSTKLKQQQPEIYAKFSKTSNVKASVRIEVADGE